MLIEYEGRQHADPRQFGRDVDRYSLDGRRRLADRSPRASPHLRRALVHRPRRASAVEPRSALVSPRGQSMSPTRADMLRRRQQLLTRAGPWARGASQRATVSFRAASTRATCPGAALGPIRPIRQTEAAYAPTPAADLEVVALQQLLAHRGGIDAVGHAHGGEFRQTVALGREQLQAQLAQAPAASGPLRRAARARRPAPRRGSGRGPRAARRPCRWARCGGRSGRRCRPPRPRIRRACRDRGTSSAASRSAAPTPGR